MIQVLICRSVYTTSEGNTKLIALISSITEMHSWKYSIVSFTKGRIRFLGITVLVTFVVRVFKPQTSLYT